MTVSVLCYLLIALFQLVLIIQNSRAIDQIDDCLEVLKALKKREAADEAASHAAYWLYDGA